MSKRDKKFLDFRRVMEDIIPPGIYLIFIILFIFSKIFFSDKRLDDKKNERENNFCKL